MEGRDVIASGHAIDRPHAGHSGPLRPHLRLGLAPLVPDDSAVLWLGSPRDDLTREFESRSCRVCFAPHGPDPVVFDHLDFGRARHDVVVAPDVLGRVNHPVDLLEAMRRALKTGGRLIASVPDAAHPAVRRALADGRSPYGADSPIDLGQLRLFTRDSLVDAIESADFVVSRLQAIEDVNGLDDPVGWIAVALPLPVPGLEMLQARFREVAAARCQSDEIAATLREVLAQTRRALDGTHQRAESLAAALKSARDALVTAHESSRARDEEFCETIRNLLAKVAEVEALRSERDAACDHALAAETRCRTLEVRLEHVVMELPRRIARAIRNRVVRRAS
jgi:hypothetical protein